MVNEKEKEKKEEEKEEEQPAPEGSGEGDKPTGYDAIDKLREERERMEAALKRKEELLEREEKLAVESALGGRSEKEQAAPEKEETPQEYKDRIMKGELREDEK